MKQRTFNIAIGAMLGLGVLGYATAGAPRPVETIETVAPPTTVAPTTTTSTTSTSTTEPPTTTTTAAPTTTTTIYVPPATTIPKPVVTTTLPRPTTVVPVTQPQAPTGTNSYLQCVKNRESRGNYQAVNPSGAAGAYQFMPQTAANTANHAGRPDLAQKPVTSWTPAEQDAMANHLYQWQGAAPWAGPGC